ncbi:putative metal-dependent phosphoesterase TrpH [Clostridiales Family XIII bacterium PM5-7]
MSYKVDFHIHSSYSDGTMNPIDIVRKYKEEEYDIIALTDHDGIDGVKEATIAGEALQIQVVPGIELATSYTLEEKDIELHLLGYYIDIEHPQLNEALLKLRQERQARNEKLLIHLNELGYQLTEDDLLDRPGKTYVGKPNFARALAKKGYAIDNPWALMEQVERKKLSTKDAITLIKEAGGMAVLAHPMKTKGIGEPGTEAFFDHLKTMLTQLKKEGLKGVECYHPSADEHQSFQLVTIAGNLHLHITEGSDFHGEEISL